MGAQGKVLRAIKNYPPAEMRGSQIKSKDIIEFLQSLTAQPQTVGNYASHLAATFAIMRPMWNHHLRINGAGKISMSPSSSSNRWAAYGE